MSMRTLDLAAEWERAPAHPPADVPMFELVADDTDGRWAVIEQDREFAEGRWITTDAKINLEAVR